MIPKVVHYIWLGGKPKDKLTEICLLTFKDKMPNYEFIEWNETNLDLDKSLEYFRKHNYLLNKRVKAVVNNQTFIGEVVGIDDSFCLQVVTHGMLLHIDSGEIEIL